MHEARPETDRIRLTGISATGHHGVLEHERRDGQTFTADVVLHVDTRPAAGEDRLDLTVDYGVLAEQVVGVLQGEPADLVETVAERIAAVALTHPPVVAVDVVLHKPQAPITVPFADVTVEIHRDRTHVPVVAAPPVVVGAAEVPQETGRHAAVPALAEEDQPLGVPVAVADLIGAMAASGPTVTGPPATGTAATGMSPADPTTAPAQAAEVPSRDRLDAPPDAPVPVVLALGSNVGASRDTLRRAVADLDRVDGLEVTAVSPLARTAAVGGPEQPDFLNAVLLGTTTLAPRDLLRACQEVEQAHGRERAERWGPRTLDVDLIMHGTTVAGSDDLDLPHPRAHERAFVLEPWAQVDPQAVLPGLGGGPVADLARTAPDREGIRWMALDWWQGPEAHP